MSGVTKRRNGIKRKGTQSPYPQRRPAFSVVGVKNMANPEGAKAREPYQNFDGESQLSESTKPPANDWREVWRVVRSPFL